MQQEPRDLNQQYSLQQQHYQQHPPLLKNSGLQKHSALHMNASQPQNAALQPNTSLTQNTSLQENASPQQHHAQQQISGQQSSAPQQNSLTSESGANNSFSAYGAGIRKQVFELVVQQALAGATWREVCASHMRINLISPQEVEQEVQRRNIASQPRSLPHAWLEHKARLNSIQHSEQSPCPCNSCMAKVLKMREFKFAPSRRV